LEINQGYTTMHGQPIIKKISLYVFDKWGKKFNPKEDVIKWQYENV